MNGPMHSLRPRVLGTFQVRSRLFVFAQCFTQRRGKWGLPGLPSRLKRRKGSDTYQDPPCSCSQTAAGRSTDDVPCGRAMGMGLSFVPAPPGEPGSHSHPFAYNCWTTTPEFYVAHSRCCIRAGSNHVDGVGGQVRPTA